MSLSSVSSDGTRQRNLGLARKARKDPGRKGTRRARGDAPPPSLGVGAGLPPRTFRIHKSASTLSSSLAAVGPGRHGLAAQSAHDVLREQATQGQHCASTLNHTADEEPEIVMMTRHHTAPGADRRGLMCATPAAAQYGALEGEWRFYGRRRGHTQYTSLDQIDASNVGELQVAWRWKAETSRAGFLQLESTPIMIGESSIRRLGTARSPRSTPPPGRRSGSSPPRRSGSGRGARQGAYRIGPRRGLLERRRRGTDLPQRQRWAPVGSRRQDR